MIKVASVLICASAVFSGLVVVTLTGNTLAGNFAFFAVSLGLSGISAVILLASKR